MKCPVTHNLCLKARWKLQELAEDLGGGNMAQKMDRADMPDWERRKYMEYWRLVCEGCHPPGIGAQKGRINDILDDLKWTHKFSQA